MADSDLETTIRLPIVIRLALYGVYVYSRRNIIYGVTRTIASVGIQQSSCPNILKFALQYARMKFPHTSIRPTESRNVNTHSYLLFIFILNILG